MDEDEEQAHVPDLPVDIDDRVRAERLRDRLDASHQCELDAHQGQADEAESDREVGPETLPRSARAHECQDQRRHTDPDEDSEPGDTAQDCPHGAITSGPAR